MYPETPDQNFNPSTRPEPARYLIFISIPDPNPPDIEKKTHLLSPAGINLLSMRVMLHIIWPRTQVGWIDQIFTKSKILRGPRWEHLTAWSRLRFGKGTLWLAFACSCVAYTLGTHQMWRRQLTNWGGAWKRAGRGYPGHRPSLWAFPGSEEGGSVDFRRKCETIFEGITAPLNSFVWFFEIRNHICDKIWVFEYTHSVSHI